MMPIEPQIRVLTVGIALRQDMKERTLRIARGEYKPQPEEPKVWFSSLESLAQVLSAKNLLLLEMIKRMQPASLTALAEQVGRKPSNLSRTLHTMERYGIVRLEKGAHGTIIPRVLCDRVSFTVDLHRGAA